MFGLDAYAAEGLGQQGMAEGAALKRAPNQAGRDDRLVVVVLPLARCGYLIEERNQLRRTGGGAALQYVGDLKIGEPARNIDLDALEALREEVAHDEAPAVAGDRQQVEAVRIRELDVAGLAGKWRLYKFFSEFVKLTNFRRIGLVDSPHERIVARLLGPVEESDVSVILSCRNDDVFMPAGVVIPRNEQVVEGEHVGVGCLDADRAVCVLPPVVGLEGRLVEGHQ